MYNDSDKTTHVEIVENPDVKDFYDFTPDDVIIEDYQKNPQVLNIPVAI